MAKLIQALLWLSLAGMGAGCAAERIAEPTEAPPVEAEAGPSWRDRLGITSLTNNVLCTYKLLAFFADTRGDRPERRTSSSDTVMSCLSNK